MNLVILPPLISLLTAISAVATWKSTRLQQTFSTTGAVAVTATAGFLLWRVMNEDVLILQVAGWKAPYGITMIADRFSAILVLVTAIGALAVILHGLAGLGEEREGFHPLVHFMLAGVYGALLAGDVFNLYVWFELMLIASFILLAMGGPPQLTGGLKYLAMNFLASLVLLSGIGLLYGATGTLNLAHMASLAQEGHSSLLIFPAALLLAGLGIKSALFPFYFWLPASYHNPAPAISALIAALLTKVGAYALVRLSTTLFLPQHPDWSVVLLILAAGTLLAGAIGAVAQEDFRRLLAFLVVSHSGYLLLGLGFYSRLGLAGTIVFTVHLILSNAALFLVAGLIRHEGGSYRLSELGGLFRRSPRITFLFLLPALSLAEMPPMPGFWAKLLLIRAGLEGEYYLFIAVILVANIFTLYALVRIWNEAFWKDREEQTGDLPPRIRESRMMQWLYFAPVGFLSLCLLLLGFLPEPLSDLALRAGKDLLDVDFYIRAVLGGGP